MRGETYGARSRSSFAESTSTSTPCRRSRAALRFRRSRRSASSASISPPVISMSRSIPSAAASSGHAAAESRCRSSVLAAGPPSAPDRSRKSYARSWTCRLPALFPEAAQFRRPRSSTTTSAPSRARYHAAQLPRIPAPTITTSASPSMRSSERCAGAAAVRGGAMPWSCSDHSGSSRASTTAGTGFTGKRGVNQCLSSGTAPAPAPAVPASGLGCSGSDRAGTGSDHPTPGSGRPGSGRPGSGSGRLGAGPRDRGAAVTPLAPSHPRPGGALEHTGVAAAALGEPADRAGGHALAPTEHRVGGRQVVERRRREQAPQRALEREAAGELPACADAASPRLFGAEMPETPRGLHSGERALSEGDPRPADPAAVARHQHPGTRCGAVLVPPRREAGERARPVVVAAAEEARQLVRGREAVAEADRVDLPGPLRARHGPAGAVDAGEDRPLRRPRTLDPHQGHVRTAASRRDAQARAGCAARRGRGRVRARRRGARRRPRDGPGRDAASATATTSTPPRTSSQATWRLSGPLPATRTRAPGATRYARTSVCAAPVVITPGSVHPGTGWAFSQAPVAIDDLTRVESKRPSVPDDADLEPVPGRIGERAPHRGSAQDLDTRPPDPFDQRPPVRILAVRGPGAGEAVTRRELLVELSAGLRPLVEHGDLRPGTSGGLGGGETARPRADDEHPVRRVHHHRIRAGGERGRAAAGRRGDAPLGLDPHAVHDLRHACALARPPVDPYEAVEADPHPAEDPARCAPVVGAKPAHTRRGQRRRHRLALEGGHRTALEGDLDRGSAADESARLQACGRHARSVPIGMRGRPGRPPGISRPA